MTGIPLRAGITQHGIISGMARRLFWGRPLAYLSDDTLGRFWILLYISLLSISAAQ